MVKALLRLCSRIRDEEAACVALAQVALHRTKWVGASFSCEMCLLSTHIEGYL